jgi:hypothetical protein
LLPHYGENGLSPPAVPLYALDPKFARAQRRYLGASGSVDHNGLRGWIPATAFTMSIQSMPPGNRIPMHCHETKEMLFRLSIPRAAKLTMPPVLPIPSVSG